MRQGDILIINFPFSDRTAGKPRPALVISNDRHNARDVDRLFVLISSNTLVRSEEELVIAPGDADFATSGLKVTSVFRCSKLVNLDSTKLRAKRIGHIGPAWVRKVADSISAVVRPSC